MKGKKNNKKENSQSHSRKWSDVWGNKGKVTKKMYFRKKNNNKNLIHPEIRKH